MMKYFHSLTVPLAQQQPQTLYAKITKQTVEVTVVLQVIPVVLARETGVHPWL